MIIAVQPLAEKAGKDKVLRQKVGFLRLMDSILFPNSFLSFFILQTDSAPKEIKQTTDPNLNN